MIKAPQSGNGCPFPKQQKVLCYEAVVKKKIYGS